MFFSYDITLLENSRYDISEILLKVALNTTTPLTNYKYIYIKNRYNNGPKETIYNINFILIKMDL